MYYDFKVKIPAAVGKIYERTIKGMVYIYCEYDRIYKPEKKYNIPNTNYEFFGISYSFNSNYPNRRTDSTQRRLKGCVFVDMF